MHEDSLPPSLAHSIRHTSIVTPTSLILGNTPSVHPYLVLAQDMDNPHYTHTYEGRLGLAKLEKLDPSEIYSKILLEGFDERYTEVLRDLVEKFHFYSGRLGIAKAHVSHENVRKPLQQLADETRLQFPRLLTLRTDAEDAQRPLGGGFPPLPSAPGQGENR
jgi:hypothetical protein